MPPMPHWARQHSFTLTFRQFFAALYYSFAVNVPFCFATSRTVG